MRTVDFDPEKHRGRQLFVLRTVRDGSQLATVAVPTDVPFKGAAVAPWRYVVDAEGLEIKGGPGSGHHGHAGRPGKRGGSAPGKGGGGQPRVLSIGDYKMLVVERSQQIDQQKIGEVNPVALSPDGTLMVTYSDDNDAFIDATHAAMIQAYQGDQRGYDRYVRGYLGNYDGKLSFYAESVQMGIGGGIYGPDDDWSALGD